MSFKSAVREVDPAVGPFNLVQVKSRSADGTVIKDCHFHDAYDGVMQLRSSGAQVVDNLFERAHTMTVSAATSWCVCDGLLHNLRWNTPYFEWRLETMVSFFLGFSRLEGAAQLTNITVERNTFIDCCIPKSSAEESGICNPISMRDCRLCRQHNNSVVGTGMNGEL